MIALIEEVEKDRDRIFALQTVREDDSRIIAGLIGYLEIADRLGKSIDSFINNDGDEVEVYVALQAWKESEKTIKVI